LQQQTGNPNFILIKEVLSDEVILND